MLKFLREHYKKIIIVLLLLASISLVNLLGRDKDYNIFEGLIIDLLRPGFEVVNIVGDWSKDALRIILDYKNVKDENQYLKEEVEKLLYNQKRMKKILEQNRRLRELLNFKEQTPYQVLGASVIGHSMDNWTKILMINRGKEAGVKQKMTVVAKEGYLVGIVQRVTNYTAQVLLVEDANFIIGGLVRNSRDLGIVKGQLDDSRLLMENLSWDAQISSGDIIVSSGISQYYPKGIAIGEVMSVSPDNYGLTQKAKIKSFVSLKKVEEVLVITDFRTKTNPLLPSLDSYSDFKREEGE